MSTTAVHNVSKDKLKAGQKNASTAGSVYNFGVDSGLSAYVSSSSFPSAGGDQHEDLLQHRHRNHQSYPATASHYNSINSANGFNPKTHNRVNSTSTDDDGDHSLSLAPDYSLNSSHQISQFSAQVNALVDKCANDSVYQLLFGSSTNTHASTGEKPKISIENSPVGKSNTDQARSTSTLLSGFQSFDPFASTSCLDNSTPIRKPKVEAAIHSDGNGKLSGKAAHQRRSDSGPRQTNTDPTGSSGLLHLDLNGQPTLFRDVLSGHSMVEHRLADSEQTVDVTAPIKVILNPRDNNYEGREAAQSPRAKASPPYADNWAMKTTFSPTMSKSENIENGGGSGGGGVPPSPPMSRKHAVYAGSPIVMGNSNHEKYIELLTQHNSFKKQLFDLEENLKRNSGRVLTESELNAVPEYKAIATQVSKVRLRLKEWKTNSGSFNGTSEAKENFTEGSGGVSGGSSNTANKEKLKTMRQTIQASMSKLAEKRREANRPFDIEQMTEVEAKIEKEQTQKELLNFEKIFGRAKTAEERQIVTELYDRYRCLKKLVRQRPSRTSAPPTIESDITDINSDFGENNSLGTHYNLNIVSSGIKRHSTIGEVGARTVTSLGEPQTSPPAQTQNDLALTSLKGATYAELQAERTSLVEKKRRLSKNLNSISRSGNTYKQQADVNELRKVKARLKQVEQFMTTNFTK